MFQAYKEKNFTATSLEIIAKANVMIKEYQQQGFTLTLRQLYYQFVARDLLPNTLRSYNRLGSIVNDARMAGWISWEASLAREDEGRNALYAAMEALE